MTRWDLFVWLLAPAAAIVAVAGTAVCVLKRRRVASLIGVVASVLAVTVAVEAPGARSESFEDIGLAATYLLAVVPATLVTLALATRPARPGSWWARRAEPPPG